MRRLVRMVLPVGEALRGDLVQLEEARDERDEKNGRGEGLWCVRK